MSERGPLQQLTRPMVTINNVGSFFTCEFGRVEELRSEMHADGPGRPCIHTIRVPLLFFVSKNISINWQPRLYTADSRSPCIASIRDGVLTLAFDAIGPCPPNEGNMAHYKESPMLLYHYDLHPVRWWDEEAECPRVVLAVRRSLEVTVE